MQIGPYMLRNSLVAAPMAGITDRPFRQLCRRMGAGLAVSEMLSSEARLRNSRKSRQRADHVGEPGPRSVQIAGADPRQMAAAARYNADHGAEIIDINMGCPAKKVCRVAAGSALLKDEALVARILEAVVDSVDVPVTLKMRTGWDTAHRNAIRIARIAEQIGVQALAIHGRTRACGYTGSAEYHTIKQVKERVHLPVIANGDIRTASQAKFVLEYTGADGIMLGRAAQGRPWIFEQIEHFLRTGHTLCDPSAEAICDIVMEHLQALYAFYGEYMGVRIARKHLIWYGARLGSDAGFRGMVQKAETIRQQMAITREFFERVATKEGLAA